MAIVPLVKVTLYGAVRQKQQVLDGLQSLACLHLLSLGEAPSEASGYVSTEAREALKYLDACPTRRRPVNDPSQFDFQNVQDETLEIQRNELDLGDQRDQLRRAIAILKPWGDFRIPAQPMLGNRRFWFYMMPHHRMLALERTDFIWRLAGKDNRFAYVVVISETEPQGIPGTRVELDERPLSELEERLEAVETELEELYWRRVALTRWRLLFARTLDEADDRTAQEYAARQALDEGSVFALAGWTPREAIPTLEDFAAQHHLALTVDNARAEDNPPTLLRNAQAFAGGEDAVTFYMTPAYGTWDPSLAVFASFAVFFGMILADAGYGLLLGMILLVLWRRMGKSNASVRLRNLILALVVTSVAYGVLVGSYFGLSPAAGSILARLHVLNAQDQGLMMRLSIGVGVFHLIVAHLVRAWGERHSSRVLGFLGWSAMLLGGYVLGLAATGQYNAFKEAGLITLASGAVGVLFFSSRRPLSIRPKELAGRLLDGVKSLAGVTQAFGDALSYLRLFALGLASAQLAEAFNDLTYSASCCMGIGALLGILVAVFGHGLNFALGIMSGVVHGLRLNCIEFFNWSLPEEGYPFRAFRKKVGQ